jgi:hypothetical protein
MSKQITAVEWLVEQLENVDYNPLEKGGYDTSKKRIIEQAKEIEKQQIINAFGIGCHHESKRLVGYQEVAEQYYNEMYGKEN